MNKRLCLSFRNGIGNFVMLSATIKALQNEGHTVDIQLDNPEDDPRRKELLDIIEHWEGLELHDSHKSYDELFYVWGEGNRKLHEPNWKITKGVCNPIEFFKSGKHEVELNYEIANYLGCSRVIPNLYCPVQQSSLIDNVLETTNKKKVFVHLGSRPEKVWLKKRWPIEDWQILLTLLTDNNIFVYFSISEWEKDDFSRMIMEALNEPEHPLNLFSKAFDKLKITETAYLISKCDLMITTDSGPMHIAAAVDTPVISLFGPTIESKNYPWKVRNIVLQQKDELSCCPCLYTNNFTTCQKNICMEEIEPGIVYEKAMEFLI